MLEKVSGTYSQFIHAESTRTVPNTPKENLISWQKTSLLDPKWAVIRKSRF